METFDNGWSRGGGGGGWWCKVSNDTWGNRFLRIKIKCMIESCFWCKQSTLLREWTSEWSRQERAVEKNGLVNIFNFHPWVPRQHFFQKAPHLHLPKGFFSERSSEKGYVSKADQWKLLSENKWAASREKGPNAMSFKNNLLGYNWCSHCQEYRKTNRLQKSFLELELWPFSCLKDIGSALITLTLGGCFSTLGRIGLGLFSCEMAQIVKQA